MTYYVHAGSIRHGDFHAIETWGPYSLRAAKDFARIGSQTGRHARAVTRSKTIFLVRIYKEGQRTFPITEVDLAGLTRGERPRKL